MNQEPFRGLTISQAYEQQAQWHAQRLREVLASNAERLQSIDQTYQAAALLDAAGFEVPTFTNWNNDGFHLEVEQRDLPRVYRALGRLKLAGKDLADCKKRLIKIALRPVDYPSIVIRYQTKLPRKAKCKIVTVREKARRYKSLVCDVA
jgi:hypothetical protein